MKTNTAKQKLRQGQPTYGYALGLGSPLAAEVLAHCGIDFIMLDRQHGSWGEDSTIAALVAMAAGPAVPMARVSRNDYTMIGRLLDDGMMGIIVPMVHTREDAEAAANACLLPPVGTRSWGWGRASLYGKDYPDQINDQMFVAVQIESTRAVENCEAIMSVPGVDACWTGPADLALSMGIDPRRQAEDDRHARALEKIIQACKDTGKAPGIACASPEQAKSRAGEGWRFLVAAGDGGLLLSAAQAGLKTMGLA